MNNKMVINTYLLTIESRKLRKQIQNDGYRECSEGCLMGEGCGGMRKEVRGLRSMNRQLQNSHGDVKYSIGNRVAKELTWT